MSNSSCKSNEDVCSGISNASPHNRDQQQHQSQQGIATFVGRNPPPTQMTHNNLPNIGSNKSFMQFRNQINQQQQNTSVVTPDVLNVNQQHFHHQFDITENGNANNNHNNLNITTTNASTLTGASCAGGSGNQQYLMCSSEGALGGGNGVGAFAANHQSSSIMNNINSYNFDLNEFKQPKTTTKMLQKSSTGSKRTRQIREREQNNLGGFSGVWHTPMHDLNLATTATRHDSKSSAKLFDDLKENVYLEVSALIAANESRPHFLINLFRDLQLISTSDPLRKRLLQAFKEVYSQCGELGCNVSQDEVSTVTSVQVKIKNKYNKLRSLSVVIQIIVIIWFSLTE